MLESLVSFLQDPASGEPVELIAFESQVDSAGQASITEGLLYCSKTGSAFPVIHGVPVMLPASFPPAFLEKHRAAIEKVTARIPLRLDRASGDDFSFSKQWQAYFEHNMDRMWGWTVDERLDQLVMEMQVTREWFNGKTILDAGCGPGDLTEAIAALGANVIGFDYSSSVYEAERKRKSPALQFVRTDASAVGLRNKSFDAVVSLGVIMFMPDPHQGFSELCRVVKPHGCFYVNVDRHPDGFFGRYIKHPPLDLLRRVVSNLSPGLQSMAVKVWAKMLYGLDAAMSGRAKARFNEYLIGSYNYLTPRWRHYLTPYQIAAWFHENGFGPPVFSHWDNPYAFGLVSVKERQAATPGVHFGSAEKIWDKKKPVAPVAQDRVARTKVRS